MKANSRVSRPKKAFVFLNPAAGTLGRDFVCQKVQQVFRDYPLPFSIHETSPGEDLHAIVKLALQQNFQHIIAVGGDGTVSGVASGLVYTSIPLTIVPTGTANALAKILQIPLDLERAFDWWLAAEQIKEIDAMRIDERFYFLNISMGVSSQALANVKREEKRKLGAIAYWLRGLQRLAGISPYRFHFNIDGQYFSTRAAELIVANSGIIQFKPLRLDPELRMDDGKLSVCDIRVKNFFDYLRLAVGLISGRPTDAPQLTCRDAHHKVGLRSKPPLPIQADGELLGVTPVSIDLVPSAAGFLVPSDAQP